MTVPPVLGSCLNHSPEQQRDGCAAGSSAQQSSAERQIRPPHPLLSGRCRIGGSQPRNVLQRLSLPRLPLACSKKAVKITLLLICSQAQRSAAQHLHPCLLPLHGGTAKPTGTSGRGAEGSSSQLPLATVARECLSGRLVADFYVTGSEWGSCAPFVPLCTTEVQDNENGNIFACR